MFEDRWGITHSKCILRLLPSRDGTLLCRLDPETEVLLLREYRWLLKNIVFHYNGRSIEKSIASVSVAKVADKLADYDRSRKG